MPTVGEGTAPAELDTKTARRAAAGGPRPVRRLLVRGPNWIGDAVMAEPALAALRHLFPSAELTLLVKPAVAELFRHHPAVTEIVVYDAGGRHAGLSGKWALATALRQRRYDLAILFQNAFEAALLTALAGIPRRYGYATDARSWLLTDPIARPDRRLKRHQVHYYYDLLRPLGLEGQAAAPALYATEEDDRQAEHLLRPLDLRPGDVLLGVNPGSTYGGAKRWLPERFAESADRLAERLRKGGRRAQVVLVGARGEEALGEAIASRMAVRPLVLSGRTSMRELMGVIRRCALFLTNDTGPMHIAAAFGVPVVAIFGPTDFEETAPVGERHRMVRQPVDCSPCLLRECPIDHRCMTGIGVEQVYRTAVGLLPQDQVVNEPQSPPPRPSGGVQERPTAEGPGSVTSLRGVTVFLDRDGTVNADYGYVTQPEHLDLLGGAAQALARLKAAGARLVLITNQSAIGRGLLDEEGLRAIHARLQDLLQEAGAALDAIYFCPHHPDDGCRCRKPAAGMIEQAVREQKLSLAEAYMVGDQRRDIELAWAAGIRAVLVLSGPMSRDALASLEAEGRRPDHVAESLSAAVDWILADVAARCAGSNQGTERS